MFEIRGQNVNSTLTEEERANLAERRNKDKVNPVSEQQVVTDLLNRVSIRLHFVLEKQHLRLMYHPALLTKTGKILFWALDKITLEKFQIRKKKEESWRRQNKKAILSLEELQRGYQYLEAQRIQTNEHLQKQNAPDWYIEVADMAIMQRAVTWLAGMGDWDPTVKTARATVIENGLVVPIFNQLQASRDEPTDDELGRLLGAMNLLVHSYGVERQPRVPFSEILDYEKFQKRNTYVFIGEEKVLGTLSVIECGDKLEIGKVTTHPTVRGTLDIEGIDERKVVDAMFNKTLADLKGTTCKEIFLTARCGRSHNGEIVADTTLAQKTYASLKFYPSENISDADIIIINGLPTLKMVYQPDVQLTAEEINTRFERAQQKMQEKLYREVLAKAVGS
ncbi:MAG: hypothetical protein WCP97_01700 [bacterium]